MSRSFDLTLFFYKIIVCINTTILFVEPKRIVAQSPSAQRHKRHAQDLWQDHHQFTTPTFAGKRARGKIDVDSSLWLNLRRLYISPYSRSPPVYSPPSVSSLRRTLASPLLSHHSLLLYLREPLVEIASSCGVYASSPSIIFPWPASLARWIVGSHMWVQPKTWRGQAPA